MFSARHYVCGLGERNKTSRHPFRIRGCKTKGLSFVPRFTTTTSNHGQGVAAPPGAHGSRREARCDGECFRGRGHQRREGPRVQRADQLCPEEDHHHGRAHTSPSPRHETETDGSRYSSHARASISLPSSTKQPSRQACTSSGTPWGRQRRSPGSQTATSCTAPLSSLTLHNR